MASKTKKTSKKAGAQKFGKAVAKKSAKKAAKNGGGPDGEVTHPPIIITDGSASIEFEDDKYPLNGSTTTHQSKDLRLTEISSNQEHGNGARVCRTLQDKETVLIVVTCQVGGTSDPRTIEIRGGNFIDGSASPSIKFDHKAFDETFKPIKKGNRRRVGKKNRNITSLEIFRVSDNKRVHDCDVVKKKKGFEITVNDDHLD